MTTIDICLGTSARDTAARVLVTVTDDASAETLVEALGVASLFQSDGLVPFARAVDRDGAMVAELPARVVMVTAEGAAPDDDSAL